MIGSAEYPMLAFGLPPDAVAWATLVLSLLTLVLPRKVLPRRPLLWISLGAAALSLGYFHYYLGGAPRIIDATAYLLEARSFAQGSVGFESPDPSASFRGRFLIHTQDDPTLLAGIFPPGYPALLSLAVRLGHFELLGPLIAAALILVTYALTYALTRRRRTALVAAVLSLLCVCLRYHHAETMSHGLSGLLSASALWATVQLTRSATPRRWAVLLGASLGLLLATRQLTGGVLLVACAASLALSKSRNFGERASTAQTILIAMLALLPGLLLLMGHQYLVTGDLLGSVQLRYYHFADGPNGCFGLGLSKGCHYEHADVIAKMGGQGLTAKWALLNTFHRLHWHSLDIANFEPLALLAIFFAWKLRRRAHFQPLLLTLVLLPLAYAFFYFNGSYPGGGARFFSELLPIWHVILAIALTSLRATRIGLSLACLGYALHGAYSHKSLAQPNFGPSASAIAAFPTQLAQAQSGSRPLLFLSSAHLFNLSLQADPRYLVARRTHDDRERFVRENIKATSTWTLSKDAQKLVPLKLAPLGSAPETFILESEFDYPPLRLENLWVHPEHLPLSCVSSGRALALKDVTPKSRISLESAGVPQGKYEVLLHVVTDRKECKSVNLGARMLPAPLELNAEELKGVSHLDRLELIQIGPSRPLN